MHEILLRCFWSTSTPIWFISFVVYICMCTIYFTNSLCKFSLEKILRYETLAKNPAWQIHVSLIIVWLVWYHPAATNNRDDCYQATKVINCVTVLVHFTVHCSYKANRADISMTWYGTPHPKFMTEQGVYFRRKDL